MEKNKITLSSTFDDFKNTNSFLGRASILNDIATSGAKSKPVAPKSLLVLGESEI